jgi:hypothetical protein
MLDVHPPEHAAHSWRDFFIHIATIVIGLIIAVGLEQTVEWVHHRREVRQTREELEAARAENRKAFAADTAVFRLIVAEQQNDMLVLQYLKLHPGTPVGQLPGTLVYITPFETFNDGAWKTAESTGVAALMSSPEVEGNHALYSELNHSIDEFSNLFNAMVKAEEFRYSDPDLSHMTPQQIDKQIDLTASCLELTFRWGGTLYELHENHPDFAPAPTLADLYALNRHNSTPAAKQAEAPAAARTLSRIDTLQTAANAEMRAAEGK